MGIVRPSREAFLNNKNNLISSLGDHEIDTFLFSWDYQLTREIEKNKDVDICVLKNESEYDEILSKYEGPGRPRNHLKMFLRHMESIRAVNSLGKKYDFLVYSRPDLETKFDAEKQGWFESEGYSAPTNGSHETRCNHDQFGIAPPEIMFKAWNFTDLNNLKSIYDKTRFPEYTMEEIQQVNGVQRKCIEMQHCQLNREWKEWHS